MAKEESQNQKGIFTDRYPKIPPLMIEILIALVVCADDSMLDRIPNSIAKTAFLIIFQEQGLMELDEGKKEYQPTDKARKWLEMICNTPLPVSGGWVDPREG